MRDLFDDLARSAAEPMPRSRALRVLLGAFVAAATPEVLRTTPAFARAHRVLANPCVYGDKTIPCGTTFCDKGQFCANDAKGECCPVGGSLCKSSFDPTQDTCCNPGETCNPHGGCCAKGTSVCGPTCCGAGEACCHGTCCPPGERCHKGKCGKCPKGTKGCGNSCCETAKGEDCCNGKCCHKDQKCCYEDHCCPKKDKCCGTGCCTDKEHCCGDHCCPEKQACCGSGCCPEGRTCATSTGAQSGKLVCCAKGSTLTVAGHHICCPPGSHAEGNQCCPNTGPCTPCDPACNSAEYCSDGVCIPRPGSRAA